MFWYQQHLRNLPDVINMSAARKNELASIANFLVMVASILRQLPRGDTGSDDGLSAVDRLARVWLTSLAMVATYIVPRNHTTLLVLLPVMGACSGLFALFTMYLPPLFPVLLRTTGAGFCYNIGRIAAAAGTVIFGLFSKVGDYRIALLCAGLLFLPATLLALWLPDLLDRDVDTASVGPSGATIAD